jgi:hypothetical protein
MAGGMLLARTGTLLARAHRLPGGTAEGHPQHRRAVTSPAGN